MGALKEGAGTPLRTMTYYTTNSEATICRYSAKEVFSKTSLIFSCEFCAILQNQVTKFGKLIECEKYFSSKIMQKIRSGDQFQTTFCLLRNFAKNKSKWLKLQVSRPEIRLKRDSSTGIFHFFQKPYLQNTFGRLLLLIPLFQPRFYHTFVITLFSFFPSCFPFYY